MKIVAPDGRLIARNVELSFYDILQQDPFEDADPDDEDYSGYTGNEGVTATHFYCATCVVIMPRKNEVDMLSESVASNDGDHQPWVDGLLKKLAAAPSDMRLRRDLEAIYNIVLRRSLDYHGLESVTNTYDSWAANTPLPRGALGTAASVALVLRRTDLLHRVIEITHGRLPLSLFEKMGELLVEAFSDWRASVMEALTSFTTISSFYEAWMRLVQDFGSAKQGSQCKALALDFVHSKVWETFLAQLGPGTTVGPDDVKPLCTTATRLRQDAFLGRVVPFVMPHVTKIDFALAFLAALDTGTQLEPEIKGKVYKDVHSALAASFDLERAFASESSVYDPKRPGHMYDIPK